MADNEKVVSSNNEPKKETKRRRAFIDEKVKEKEAEYNDASNAFEKGIRNKEENIRVNIREGAAKKGISVLMQSFKERVPGLQDCSLCVTKRAVLRRRRKTRSSLSDLYSARRKGRNDSLHRFFTPAFVYRTLQEHHSSVGRDTAGTLRLQVQPQYCSYTRSELAALLQTAWSKSVGGTFP